MSLPGYRMVACYVRGGDGIPTYIQVALAIPDDVVTQHADALGLDVELSGWDDIPNTRADGHVEDIVKLDEYLGMVD